MIKLINKNYCSCHFGVKIAVFVRSNSWLTFHVVHRCYLRIIPMKQNGRPLKIFDFVQSEYISHTMLNRRIKFNWIAARFHNSCRKHMARVAHFLQSYISFIFRIVINFRCICEIVKCQHANEKWQSSMSNFAIVAPITHLSRQCIQPENISSAFVFVERFQISIFIIYYCYLWIY